MEETQQEVQSRFHEMIDQASDICVLGHIGPDGDCLGSTLAVRNYIAERCRRQGAKKKVQVYLEAFSSKFDYLPGASGICSDTKAKGRYDLAIICDCADAKRLGPFAHFMETAKHTFCLDHHVTNDGFANVCVIRPDASSTCEVLFDLLDHAFLTRETAECIYTGIIHDTGVFRYSSTSAHTMEIAGACMKFGFDFGAIIDDSFFSMSYPQKLALGRVLSEMRSYLDGRLVTSFIDRKTMNFYGVTGKEMDGIIDQMGTTRGALCALFQYETLGHQFKISMRSNSDALNVAAIAQKFGGGGHVKAAGCFMGMDPEENIKRITAEVEKQIG